MRGALTAVVLVAVLGLVAGCGTSDNGGTLTAPTTAERTAPPLDHPCRLLGSLLAANALGKAVGPGKEAPSPDGGVACTYTATDGNGSVSLTTFPSADPAAAYGTAAVKGRPLTGLGDAAAAVGNAVVVRKGAVTFLVDVEGVAGQASRTLAGQILDRLP